jgi:ATP-dependent DNA ligase
MEGVMAKRADSHYVGARTTDWFKFKRAGYHDGWERPTRK